MARFADLLAKLGSDPHVRGRRFEHVCKWFLLNAPEYKARVKHVWLWDEWDGKWGADAGIDLVAETHTGELWAVQAKAYDPRHTVTKRDVDTFVSESSRKQFSFRLLIATTDKLGATAGRTLAAQEKPVSFLGLEDLQSADVKWNSNPLNDKPARRPKPSKPRPHQRKAMTAVVKGFSAADRGQLIMACGTGKTLTSLFITERLDAQRVLVLVPSLSLLKQTMHSWRSNSSAGFESMPVCSDDTVGSEPDAAVSTVSDIGVPVTTDPAAIAAFLRKRGARVVFSTYQSSPQVAAAQKLSRTPRFDLVIADEAHRVAGKGDAAFGTVLDDTAIRAKRRLFMTATPRYFTGRVLDAATNADLKVASMDDPAKFGEVFHRLSFGEAIRDDLLTGYQVVVMGVSDAECRAWAENAKLLTRDGKTTDARTLAAQVGLAKAMRRYDLRRIISFHSRVSHARKFAAELPEVISWMPARQRPKGSVWTDFAAGDMTAGERHKRLQHLGRLDDGDRGLLANARCLSEGVDVPTLDGVAFIDPRRSEVDIVQAVGRAIRKADDKTIGTIVIPVFIGTDEDPAAALDSSDFTPVWAVVQALRAHDDELAEKIDALRRDLGKRGGSPKLPDKIHLDLPIGVEATFADAFDVRLVERTSFSWEFWFGLFQRYVEEHGTTFVPAHDRYGGYRLGGWVSTQRSRQAVLTADQVLRLEALPGWVWDRHGSRWEEGYRHLLDYVAKHGNTLITSTEKYRNYPLGTWAAIQRRDYQNGKLSEERHDRLEAVPGWTWSLEATRWGEGYRRMWEYVVTQGTSLVPQPFETDDGFRLGAWVAFQRSRYQKGKLERSRVERLERCPGWVWSATDAKWDRAFQLVAEYAHVYGTARVPRGTVVDGVNIGDWVLNNRSKFSKLSTDRQKRLDSLPGWTDKVHADTWDQRIALVQRYVDEHGTAAVARDYVINGFPLGSWVGSRRNEYKKGLVTPDRVRQLQSFPGWDWAPRSGKWKQAYQHLLAYTRENSSCRLPDGYVTEYGHRLGAWVRTQRTLYKNGELAAERIEKLEALPGWVWDTHAAQWEAAFGRLVAYVAKFETPRVPPRYQDPEDGMRLGGWVAQQRQKYRAGRLTDEQVQRLESLPEWVWNPSRTSP